MAPTQTIHKGARQMRPGMLVLWAWPLRSEKTHMQSRSENLLPKCDGKVFPRLIEQPLQQRLDVHVGQNLPKQNAAS